MDNFVNKVADTLATDGSATRIVGPEPILPLALAKVTVTLMKETISKNDC